MVIAIIIRPFIIIIIVIAATRILPIGRIAVVRMVPVHLVEFVVWSPPVVRIGHPCHQVVLVFIEYTGRSGTVGVVPSRTTAGAGASTARLVSVVGVGVVGLGRVAMGVVSAYFPARSAVIVARLLVDTISGRGVAMMGIL